MRGVYHVPVQHVRHAPTTSFAGLGVISCFGHDVTVPTPVRRRKIPGGTVKIVLALDGAIAGGAGAPRALVVGLHDRPVLTEYHGRMRGVQLQVDPTAAYRLLGVPLSELRNQVVDLAEFFGKSAGELLEKLADNDEWTSQCNMTADLLRHRMAAAREVDQSVLATREHFRRRGGSVPIATLADELGCSRRNLTRRFTEQVGLPPKTYGSLLRFSRALSALASSESTSLAQIAIECGYHDQSHLNRDFRWFAQCSPTSLLQAVPIFQDEPPRVHLA